MHAQESWDRLLAAYAAGDWDNIEEHAHRLLDWLEQDGSPPCTLGRTDLGPDWDRALARAGCLLALEAVNTRYVLHPSGRKEAAHAG